MKIVKQAIYKHGALYLTEDVDLSEYQVVRVIIEPLEPTLKTQLEGEEYAHLVEQQQRALKEIVGIGESGKPDISQHVDTYLYSHG